MRIKVLDHASRPWGKTIADTVVGDRPFSSNVLVEAARKGHAQAVAILSARVVRESCSISHQTTKLNHTEEVESQLLREFASTTSKQAIFDTAAVAVTTAASDNAVGDGVLLFLLNHDLVSGGTLESLPTDILDRAKGIAAQVSFTNGTTLSDKDNDNHAYSDSGSRSARVIEVVDKDEDSVDSDGDINDADAGDDDRQPFVEIDARDLIWSF